GRVLRRRGGTELAAPGAAGGPPLPLRVPQRDIHDHERDVARAHELEHLGGILGVGDAAARALLEDLPEQDGIVGIVLDHDHVSHAALRETSSGSLSASPPVTWRCQSSTCESSFGLSCTAGLET